LDTRLDLTLPDGQRIGFSFMPVRHELPGLVYYTPAWQADQGAWKLDSVRTLLSVAGVRLYDLKTARPYNPAGPAFEGAAYTLIGPDGTVYQLNAAGEVQQQVTPQGLRLFFSDSGITAPNGDAVQFIRDASTRLVSIIGPDGTRVLYTYDCSGNLFSARN